MTSSVRTTLAAALLASASLLAPGMVSPAHAADTFPEYDRYFDTGPAQIPLHDTKWVPQGLARVGANVLAISYYDWTGQDNSRIILVDRATGERLRGYTLPNKSHVGGIATTDEYLWVAGEGVLRKYAFSSLLSTRSTPLVQIGDAIDVAGKASYLYAEGETLWVGNFNSTSRDWMYQYRVGGAGGLTYVQDRRTPSEVQGVIVTDNKIIWSTSEGRTNPGRLIVWPKGQAYDGSTDKGNALKAPNMIEGIVLSGGEIQAVFESGADRYNGSPDGDGMGTADVQVRTIQHGSIPPLP